MKIFLTGATGYLGSAIAGALLRAGHQIRGLARDAEKATKLKRQGVEPLLGDFERPIPLIIAAQDADVLIHAGLDHGSNASRLDRLTVQALLAGACRGRAKLFIYTSGTWLIGASKDQPADETCTPNPPRVVEWRPSVERLVLDAATPEFSTVVLRPGCVYGDRRGLIGRILHYLIEDRRVRIIENGFNRWATVYIDDLAELYRLIIERRPRSAIYHATDGSADTVRRIVKSLVDEAGGGQIENLSLARARTEMGPIAEALAMDQWVSSEKVRRELGWKPHVVSAADNARLLLEEWHEAEAPLTLV